MASDRGLGEHLKGEVAQDYADRLLTRREALRRLVLHGLSASGTAALLTACGGDDAPDSVAPTTTATAVRRRRTVAAAASRRHTVP